ncbi:uncharacterized protein LOC107040897 [Diachasma alloeum]|uniref:uncharacterized protein LOC107040896 n=1 Tax=Diachasma alloeum TaxID=454923 RepID=UPI00073821C5|nr:uncharacterized protein LOC107040896 [Diachasma alloeum]XP_015116655.1 uncharacterized protein LOC107040897 [Diachasma alloeum]
MGEAGEITKRLRGIEQECGWIAGEINFLNNRVDGFKERIKTLEAEMNHLQQIQDAVSGPGEMTNDRLSGLMQQRRRNLVEIQYALPSTYEELRKLETVLLNLQQEAFQLAISLSFTSMSIGSN